MRTIQRKRAPSVSFGDSDTENDPPADIARPNKKLRRSLKADSSGGSADFVELKDLLLESDRRREAGNKEMVDTLRESTSVYEKTSERYLEVLSKLVEN